MSKFQEAVVTEDGSTINVVVKKPTNDQLKEADIHKAKAWNKAFREGVMTKAEVEKIMVERGIWSEEKSKVEARLTQEILELEKRLYRGDGKAAPKLSDGRDIAIEMRKKRIELRDLISERLAADDNTAESLADNARFDFLVYKCSYNGDTDQPLFPSYEDYNNRGSSRVAVTSAQLLARMIYDLDSDFEDKLPENAFLKQHNLVNNNGQLIDPKTKETVDPEGRRINELGHYLDDDGHRVDIDGNRIDEDGLYEMVEYENDLYEEAEEKPAPKPRKKRTTRKTTAKKTEQVETE
tara:strand:+ start:2405 stop:3289 length:885 start_codon:yes stop_codon:yes gene_type:complete